MADVFISYSRVNKAFVQRLHAALSRQTRDIWVDWEDIEYAEDWWQKICAGIYSADHFVFVISPDSVRSRVCRDEIEQAVSANKRLIPVLHVDVVEDADKAQMHPAIRRHNWLPFRETDDFEHSFRALLEVIDSDPEHVRAHTRLLVRAQEWAGKDESPSRFLRGDDLKAAENWLAAGLHKEPRPTDLQMRFISASRQAETARTRLLLAGVSIALLVTLALSVVSALLFVRAEDQRAQAESAAATAVYNEGVARSIALASQARLQFDTPYAERAPLLALEAVLRYPYSLQAENALADSLNASRVRRIFDMGAENWANAAAFSPDGTRLVAVGGGLFLWDVTTGLTRLTLEAGGYYVAFSPDGTRLATSHESQVLIRDARNGEILQSLPTPQGMWSVRWSPDGEQLLTTGRAEGGVVLWDVERGIPRLTLSTAASPQADWSPDGARVATSDGAVSVWDAQSGERLLEIDSPDELQGAVWSPDGQRLAVIAGSIAQIRDASSGQVLLQIFGHHASVSAVHWSPDGTQVVTASRDGSARIWDAWTGQEVFRYYTQMPFATDAVWSPDGLWMAVLGGTKVLRPGIDGGLRVLRIAPENPLLTLPGFSLSRWSPDGRFLLTNGDGGVRISDAQSGEDVLRFGLDLPDVTSWTADWSLDGQRFVAGGSDYRLRIVDVATRAEGQTLDVSAYTTALSTLAWSPDGRRIAFGGAGGTAGIWTLEGDGLVTFTGSSNYVYALDWSPDSSRLLVVDGGAVRIIDAEDGAEVGHIPSGDDVIHDAQWSHDGRLIAAGYTMGDVRLWDAETLTERAQLLGHTDSIEALVWAPNDERLATASSDRTVRLWNVHTGVTLLELTGHTNVVFDVDWSPDGERLVSAALDDTTRVWRVWQSLEDLVEYARACCAPRSLTVDELRQFGLSEATSEPPPA